MTDYCRAALKAILVLLLTILINAVPGLAATDSLERGPIKIGFVTSLTGPGSPSGKAMVKGANLYLQQVQHRFSGRPVELIVEDDETQPTTAASKLRKLVEADHVQVLDGLVMSNIAYHVAPLIDKMKIPMILALPNADDLTKRSRYDWIIRTFMAASQAPQPFGEWVRKHLGYKRVVVFGMDVPLGWETVGGFQKTFEQAGGMIVQKVWAPLFQKDLSPWIKQIRPDADALFLAVASEPAELAVKQYKQSGGKLPLIGIGQAFVDEVLMGAGDECLGGMSAMNYSHALHTPANDAFVRRYQEQYPGTYPSAQAEAAYVSLMWIDSAIRSLKGNAEDAGALMSALKAVRLENAPRGPIRLDSFGNPVENIYVLRVEKIHGHYQNTVVDVYHDVSQFWRWTPEEFLKQPPYSRTYPPCKYCSP